MWMTGQRVSSNHLSMAGIANQQRACSRPRVAAAQFWPWPDDPPKADDQSKAMRGRRTPRGAKTAWNWEKALIEASVFMDEHGLPETRDVLLRHVADWFGDDGPGETQITEHIAPLYRALARARGR
jgi:hypothetical protein